MANNVTATLNAISPFISNIILQGKQRKRDEKRRAEDFLRSDKIRAEDLEAKLAEGEAKKQTATLLARRNFFTQRGRNLSTEQRISGREELFGIEPGPQAPPEEVALKDFLTRMGITASGDITDLAESGQIPGISRSAKSIQDEEKRRLTNEKIESLIKNRESLIKNRDLNKIKTVLLSTNAKIDDARQKIAGFTTVLKDLRIKTKDLNRLAFASDEKLELTGQTKEDRTQARLDLRQVNQDEAKVRLDIKKLERSLSAVGSQRDALQKKLDIPETPESRNLERILKLERDPSKAFQMLNKDPAIKNKLALIRQAATGGTITKSDAVKRFVELFLEAIQRGSVSQQLMQSLADEFVKTLDEDVLLSAKRRPLTEEERRKAKRLK